MQTSSAPSEQVGPIRKLAAILSADVVGDSRLMGDDDRATLETLAAYRQVMRDRIVEHAGRVVDSPGDAMLAEFSSPVEAVRAALEIQRDLAERNALLPEPRKMLVRLGLNLGDVIEEAGALYGDGVNVAARLQSLSPAGGICVSGTAFDQVEGKLPVAFQFAGEQTVENIAKPVRAYHVVLPGRRRGPDPKAFPNIPRRVLFLAVVFVAVVVLVVSAWQMAQRNDSHHAASADQILAMPTGPVVAVLPFANLSGDASQDYFSDGLTEDVITELARFRDLHVLARNTTYQYKGKPVDVPAVGRKLGAKYVLEGSVRMSSDRIRITAQLINTQTGVHVWAERYDRDATRLFELQAEMAGRIVAAIASEGYGALHLTERQIANAKPPSTLSAYDHVLRGTVNVECWSPGGYARCKSELEKAIAADPGYARARRDYAWWLLIGWIFRFEKTPAPPSEIKVNAIESVDLDPNDPVAHKAAAFAYFFDKQLGMFEREAQIALELAPNNANILAELGFLYVAKGEWDRGIDLVSKGHVLNAESASGWYYAALFYDFYRKGRYREALHAVELHPLQNLVEQQQKYVAVYAELGNIAKAREHWASCVELDPEWSAQRLREIGELWNFPKAFWDRYMSSVAKAGYTE